MTRFPTAAHLCSWARFAPGVKESAGQEEGQRLHRARQPLPGPGPGRGRRRRRQDRHLPRRALPADRPPPRQEEGHRRGRPLHPGHRLAPAVRPRGPLPRPRRRTSTTPASAPSARNATTSANSKPSATRSPSNPPPDHRSARPRAAGSPSPHQSRGPVRPSPTDFRIRWLVSFACWSPCSASAAGGFRSDVGAC